MPPSVDAPPDLSGLLELSRIENLDLKPVILRVQTDLFVRAAARDRTEIEIFESLACGLIPTVDEETARVVARKLAPCPETPPAVLEALALRGGEARDAVVELAPTLSHRLIEAALAEGSDIAARIAARAGLSREAVDELSARAAPRSTARWPPISPHPAGGSPGAAREPRPQRPRPRPAPPGPARVSAAEPRAPVPARRSDPPHGDRPGRRGDRRPAPLPAAAPRPRRDLTGMSAARDVPAFMAALADGLGLPRDFLTVVADASARYDLLTLGLRAAGLHEEEAVYIS